MKNIHQLDDDMVESLVNMFNSKDTDTVKMALTIVNNADFNDSKIVRYVSQLQNCCSGLQFALFQNIKGDIRARFTYLLFTEQNMFMIEDDTDFDDNNEYIPYDPYDDLSDELKFKYKLTLNKNKNNG